MHGVDPDADEDAGPRPEYDPARHSLTARERAKAAELTAAGYQVSVSTVGNFRRRYQTEWLLGLADRRPVRKKPQFGTVDDIVVEAMRKAVTDPKPPLRASMSEDTYRTIWEHYLQGATPTQTWHNLLDDHVDWIPLTTVTKLFLRFSEENDAAELNELGAQTS